jgi:hypothetical protein
VDPRVAAQEEFLRALNAVMLKLLEHADPTTSFVALLNLLGRPQSSVRSLRPVLPVYAWSHCGCRPNITS